MYNSLKQLRISKGLTVQQFAALMEVSSGTIIALENGLINKIASFFDVPSEHLIDLDRQAADDRAELLRVFRSLNDLSKGILLERANCLADESSN